MVKIICGACSKPLSIDETKLPMKEVSFPCPLCKTKLKIDRSQLPADSDEPHRAEVAGSAAAQSSSPASPVVPQSMPAIAGSENAAAAGTPTALIVGESSPDLEQAARELGCTPLHRSTPAEGRDYYVQEFPEVVLISPSAISQPPMDELTPMTSVGPAERRRGFFILVGEKFRSLDGNAAFLYGVNMVVSTKDLASISRLYEEARKDHDRLTRGFIQLATE